MLVTRWDAYEQENYSRQNRQRCMPVATQVVGILQRWLKCSIMPSNVANAGRMSCVNCVFCLGLSNAGPVQLLRVHGSALCL